MFRICFLKSQDTGISLGYITIKSCRPTLVYQDQEGWMVSQREELRLRKFCPKKSQPCSSQRPGQETKAYNTIRMAVEDKKMGFGTTLPCMGDRSQWRSPSQWPCKHPGLHHNLTKHIISRILQSEHLTLSLLSTIVFDHPITHSTTSLY